MPNIVRGVPLNAQHVYTGNLLTLLNWLVMTWVALIFTPVVLAYQGWTYWVFRKRLTRSDIAQPPVTGPEMEPVGGRS